MPKTSLANTTTCSIKPGYRVYYIQRNGKLGNPDRSTGTTQATEYECIKDRYYHRIHINGRWRYVSVEAEASAANNSTSSIYSTNLALNENFIVRNAEGKQIASTFGEDIDRQNVRVQLDEQGTPILNDNGLVSVEFNYRNSNGKLNTAPAWISPSAIVSYEETFNASGGGDQDANQNAPSAEERIYILDGLAGIAPRTEPNLTAPEVDNTPLLNDNSEVFSTGHRICDNDSRKCFVEVQYTDNEDEMYFGWVDEQQTSLNPEYELIRQNPNSSPARVYEQGPHSEVADPDSAEGTDYKNSDDWYNQRFTPEEQASHRRIHEALKNYRPANYETHRGLVRMHNDRRGFCGSYHYATETNATVGASNEIQTYANPTTACVIARLAQTWKKYHCPDGGDDNGCRLSTGDISHRTLSRFDGHKTHTNGECFDIRPMRKSGVGPTWYQWSEYDRDKTRDLIKVLKDLGGTNIHFNDPKLIKEGLATHVSGHHNHIHVCFKANNRGVKNSCNTYAPDYEVCPALQGFFDSDLMKQFEK